jgi:hypothetical protein
VIFRLLLVGSLCLNIALLCRNSDARWRELQLPASKYGKDILRNEWGFADN